MGTKELVQGAAARHSPLVQSVAASTSKLQETIHGAVGDLPAAQSAPLTTLLATKRLQRQQSRARLIHTPMFPPLQVCCDSVPAYTGVVGVGSKQLISLPPYWRQQA